MEVSSIAPNHPHLPSCLSVPLKTSESSPNISLWVPSSFFYALAPLASPLHSRLLGSLDARAIKLHARQAPFEPAGPTSKLTSAIGMTPDVTLASLSFASFDLRRSALSLCARFRLFTHDRAERGHRLLSDVFISHFLSGMGLLSAR